MNGSTVRQERHVFLSHNAGYDTLITMSTGHLIAFVNLTFLSDVYTYKLVYTGRQFIIVFTRENANRYNLTRFAVRYTQRRIAHFPFLVTENSPQKTFFRSQFRFALRRNFSDKNVTGHDIGTDANNTAFIEVLRAVFTYIGNFTCNFFSTQFSVTCIAFIFFYMNGCINIIFRQFFT